jgi:hypothetical protein
MHLNVIVFDFCNARLGLEDIENRGSTPGLRFLTGSCSSGLREGEILSLKTANYGYPTALSYHATLKVPLRNLGAPSTRENATIPTGISRRYRPERRRPLLSITQQDFRRVFEAASRQCRFKIRPEDLRDWFAQETATRDYLTGTWTH